MFVFSEVYLIQILPSTYIADFKFVYSVLRKFEVSYTCTSLFRLVWLMSLFLTSLSIYDYVLLIHLYDYEMYTLLPVGPQWSIKNTTTMQMSRLGGVSRELNMI